MKVLPCRRLGRAGGGGEVTVNILLGKGCEGE